MRSCPAGGSARLRTGSFGGGRGKRCWHLAFLACAVGLSFGAAAAGEYEVRIDVTEDVRALGSEDAFEWEPAADRLSALGSAAWPVLLRALEGEGPAVREGIVSVFLSGTEANASVLEALMRLSRQDSEEAVREVAVQALRKLGREKSTDGVVAALGDPSPAVRRVAITACTAICTSDAALARLVELALADEPLSNALQAQRVLYALTSEGQEAAITGKVRAGAAAALRESPRETAEKGGSDQRALLAALLLAQLDDASRLDLLVVATKPDQPQALRGHAVYALGRLGSADQVPLLADLLRDPALSLYAYDALRRMSERGIAQAQIPASTYTGPRAPDLLPRP
jgi:HEAT repeat protein